DHYFYEKSTHSLTGRRAGNSFRLGDAVRVRVVRVDVDRRELDFRLVQPAVAGPRPQRPASPSHHGRGRKASGQSNKPNETGHNPRRKKRRRE
ncbi:MAG TPA: ribonuclease R, partial [Pirellulales bacterium]|nr:ribonuclease R [Pirellulales bacterium]